MFLEIVWRNQNRKGDQTRKGHQCLWSARRTLQKSQPRREQPLVLNSRRQRSIDNERLPHPL